MKKPNYRSKIDTAVARNSEKEVRQLLHQIVKVVEVALQVTPPVTDGTFNLGSEPVYFTAEELLQIYAGYKNQHSNCDCNKKFWG